MFDGVYNLLQRLGYSHPIHPPLTHWPIGMAMAVFIFALYAWLARRKNYEMTLRHVAVLALIGAFPTALLGFMDWQHRYAGAPLPQIRVKIVLAVLLVVFLIAALVMQRRLRAGSRLLLIPYALALACALGLGYFGAQLVYTDPGAAVGATAPQSAAGNAAFETSCAACHPGGGNTIKPNLTLVGAPQLRDFQTFLAYVRRPKARDGSDTVMPAFDAASLPDRDARQLYDYVNQAFRK
jgi:uncharacterized membrane protein